MTQDQGIAALEAGNFADAIVILEAAAEAAPENGAIRYNLAQALRHVGREGDAIIQLTDALACDPELISAAQLLNYLLTYLQLRDPGGINAVGLAAAFNFNKVDHQVLGYTSLSYLKHCTALGDALMQGRVLGWDAAAKWLLSSKGKSVLRDPLLLTTLSTTANTDLDVEGLLTAVRRAILLAPLKDTLRKRHILEFACALARQLEINEYVFAVSIDEQERFEDIIVNLPGLRDGSRAAAENLLLKALYAPLWELLGEAGKDIDGRTIKPQVLANQIADHMAKRCAEAKAAQGIDALGSIKDKTSQNVAQLYEENPYPRWLSLHAPSASGRRNQLIKHFTEIDRAFMDAPFKVLIAGSGTGQQAIDAALGYGQEASLTAIDISLASLAYAKYMANQFAVRNLHFIQCDILNAGLLDDVFDVIESVGVLHHMEDPWRGWKGLIEKLRPGGLMKIGLYSQAARRSIASLRRDIKAQNLRGDEQTIRAYRQDIIALGDEGKGASLRQSADFYTLSNFRDLMFHVSECHMMIPEIAAFMATNDLTFHGFQMPLDIADGYPEGDNSFNLEYWQDFEEAHPNTFKGMYVFWCRKT